MLRRLGQWLRLFDTARSGDLAIAQDFCGSGVREVSTRTQEEWTQPHFTLSRLERENPGLAHQFLWRVIPAPSLDSDLWLHLGCGVRVFDGFLNVDLYPQHPRVVRWNLLDIWPEDLERAVAGVFSEDCLEHFFLSEQVYILSNVNRCLRSDATARILMPSLERIIARESRMHVLERPRSRGNGNYTGGDAINFALRFTGHRWIHTQDSLTHAAHNCGLNTIPTGCAKSTVPELSDLNLRSERDSASFANDLKKRRHISRIVIPPSYISGAEKIENVNSDQILFEARGFRPMVRYNLGKRIKTSSITCINFRSSNLSNFGWPTKVLKFNDVDDDTYFQFDETLKSRYCMNIITRDHLHYSFKDTEEIYQMYFSPARNAGEYFTVGCMEVFFLEKGDL
jgi:hypothetical protein